METLLANVTGKVRRETLNDREHLVAPLSLIVPGVLNGSKGPLLYPPEEIARNPSDWNGMPIVVYHPERNGIHISARDPQVLNTQGIGTVFNAVADGKLVAEGWFDIEKTRAVDSRVIDALDKGEPIELSTGLFTTDEPAPEGAVHNDKNGGSKPYTFIARNYRPDHLAILPDRKGACSINDGCGVLVNEEQPGMLRRILVALGLTANQPSHSEVHMALAGLLRQRYGNEAYIMDVFDKHVVYEHNGKTYKVGYSTDLRADQKVELSGETQEVRRSIQYKPVNNDAADPKLNTAPEEIPMARKELVDKLIANCSCWEESDREVLANFSDAKLENLIKLPETVVANALPAALKKKMEDDEAEAKKKEATANAAAAAAATPPKPLSATDWINQAPPEIQSVVRNAMAVEAQEKAQLVGRLTANATDETAKQAAAAVYNAMDVTQLRALAAAQPALPQANPGMPMFPSYFGAAPPASTPAANADASDDILPLPTINWAEERKAQTA